MFTFLSNNGGTIITGLVLLVIVTLVIIKIYRDKKKGRCAGCSCDCGSCDLATPPKRDAL
ncbi:MAG: FeoB-associated Cys-rich membrane protein [Spirochaetes bacterium]|nr:FeoB-associated Cys-rich membrane protein [Spirochaetota bacterium]